MFLNREDAGKMLSQLLLRYKHAPRTLVLGIPRGGVIVAAEIAHSLSLPLDVVVIKKVSHPFNEELALGAVSGKAQFLLEQSGAVSQEYVQQEIKQKQQEAQQRLHFLRGAVSFPKVKGKTVILVDDGIATGATMMLAVQLIRKQRAKKIIVAVPVASTLSLATIRSLADEVICVTESSTLTAIGEFYKDFQQVEEEEIKDLLHST